MTPRPALDVGSLVEVGHDQREDIARGVLAEDAIDVPVARDHLAFVQLPPVRLGEALQRARRALRLEARVLRAVHEQDRQCHPVDVRQVHVVPFGIEQTSLAREQGQLPERLDVGFTEHLGKARGDGRVVQLFEVVQPAVERRDAVAGGFLRALGTGHRHDHLQHLVEQPLAQRVGVGRACVDDVNAHGVKQLRRAQEGQRPLREPRHYVVGRDLRDDGGAHAFEASQQRHSEGCGAEAVGDDLHRR